MKIQFTDANMSSFAPNKFIDNNNNASITSLDFCDNANWCISASTNDSLDLWDTELARHDASIPSKKYGCKLARFAHNATSCLYASTKYDDDLRYLDLHTNQYIRFLRGHKGSVTSLELSSVDNNLLSSSNDGTVRLWDLNSPNCTGLMSMDEPTPLLASFDATGLVFAVLSRALNTICVYDTRNFDREPFLTFRCEAPGAWTKLEFSNDGKYILVATDSNSHAIYNSFSGDHVTTLKGFQPLGKRTSSQAAFSINGEYVYGSCADQKVAVWNLKPEHIKPEMSPWVSLQARQDADVIAFNPKSMLMASAHTALSLWLPTAGLA